MDLLESILSDNEVTVLGDLHGTPLYSFEDANKVNTLSLARERLEGKKVELGQRPTRPDGLGYTETRSDAVALPPTFFENRYKKVEVKAKELVKKKVMDEKTKKEKEVQVEEETTKVQYEVVTDYRACREQARGTVYTNNIPVYIIGAEKKDGGTPKLVLVGKKVISDQEFVNEFKGKLNAESMTKIMKLIDVNPIETDNDELQF